MQRLGMLFYILSRLMLGSICQADSICQGMACYSISCHSLAVSAKAWHAILYFVTQPWQYLQRLCMLFYILSLLGSICRGLAQWHAILYLVTPWQYQLKDQPQKNPTYKSSSLNLKNNPRLQKPKLQKPELWKALKAQVEQTETCRRAGVRGTCDCVNMLRRM